MVIKVVEAKRGKIRRDFIALPYRLASDYPNWILPLRMQTAEMMDTKKHPFFENSEALFFVAYRNNRAVGRIAAIEDRDHNLRHKERTLHFGFFDCEDDMDVAQALFQRVEEEARGRQMMQIRGPFNHSVHEEIGLQISDFDKPNYVMIPGNAPYYPMLVEAQGYAKSIDLWCYGLELAQMNERFLKRTIALRDKLGVTVRAITKKSFDVDTKRLRSVYNAAWENNWPWRQASESEFDHIVQNMRQIADLDLVLIAEDANGDVIGFTLAVPNANEAFAHVPSGRLLPFGLPKLLWFLRPGRVRTARVIAMGVVEPWRRKGIDSIFHYLQREAGMAKGITHVELSQVLETNTMMERTAKLVGGHRRMTHRIYEKTVR